MIAEGSRLVKMRAVRTAHARFCLDAVPRKLKLLYLVVEAHAYSASQAHAPVGL
jgi:hypothetical protein